MNSSIASSLSTRSLLLALILGLLPFGGIARAQQSNSGSIGLNFAAENNDQTHLSPDTEAGYKSVDQKHWNNLIGPEGKNKELTDSKGKVINGMNVSWAVPGADQNWRSTVGRDWGFKDGNLTLQLGYIQLGAVLKIQDIPYEKYDVYVYVGAGDNAGEGSVTLSASNKQQLDPNGTYFYKLGWLNGKYQISEATSLEANQLGNVVVFKGNSAPDVVLEWAGNLKGGWTGVTGIQIVASKK
ncbi:hypothetical protein P3T73_17555 [Kiritimatiellota bacterium B12222]|nr:hypothetical protein P3T73_17555 [Kiritimatiellota bacterium B12222]